MDEPRSNIEKILNQFTQEELGNRLSQFSMISLKNLILSEIDKANAAAKTPVKENDDGN